MGVRARAFRTHITLSNGQDPRGDARIDDRRAVRRHIHRPAINACQESRQDRPGHYLLRPQHRRCTSGPAVEDQVTRQRSEWIAVAAAALALAAAGPLPAPPITPPADPQALEQAMSALPGLAPASPQTAPTRLVSSDSSTTSPRHCARRLPPSTASLTPAFQSLRASRQRPEAARPHTSRLDKWA